MTGAKAAVIDGLKALGCDPQENGNGTAVAHCPTCRTQNGLSVSPAGEPTCQTGCDREEIRRALSDAVSAAEQEQSDGPNESAFALSLDDFIAAKSDAPSALVGDEDDNLLPAGGLAILFAKGGRGKTTLTIDGAFHFASGVEWLSFKVSRPLRILIIENEGPREPFRRKLALKRKLWEHDIPGEIYVHTEDWGSLVLSADRIGRLRQFITEHHIDLVVGDPLDSLGVRGVGSPEDTREFCKLLVATGLTRDVAFWLLHHPRKADTEDELDEVSGAWGGRVDSLLKLDKLDGNRARLSFPKVRWSRRGSRPASILAFEPDSESFTFVGEEREEEERDYKVEIAALLSERPWLTSKEIAAPREPKDDAEEPGIGAAEKSVRSVLGGNPDTFESRTGADAQALGRSFNAVLWRLSRAPNSDDSDDSDEGGREGRSSESESRLRSRDSDSDDDDTPVSASPPDDDDQLGLLVDDAPDADEPPSEQSQPSDESYSDSADSAQANGESSERHEQPLKAQTVDSDGNPTCDRCRGLLAQFGDALVCVRCESGRSG